MRITADGWLEGVVRRPSPDCGGSISPELVVIHYTGAGGAEGSIAWLTKRDDVYVSAHVVIGRDGSVTQLVPFGVKAYHAGESFWRGRRYANGFSVGIELANYGLLESRDGACWSRTLTPVAVGAEWVRWARHRNGGPDSPWEKYRPEQLQSALRVCKALLGTYPIADLLGHDDVAPGRKIDPGPLFPLNLFRCLCGIQPSFSQDAEGGDA